MSIELELKFSASLKTLEQLRASLPKIAKPAASQRLFSTYYDTADGALRQLGFALRIRQQGNRYVQTLKGGGQQVAGLHQREEYDTPLTASTLCLTALARHSFLKAVPLDQVQAIFISDFQRDCFEWQQDHTHIEIALDEGQLYCPAGRRSQAIAELELELELEQKQGTPEALYQLGLQLTQQYPLFLEVTSKAAQGYALANASEPPVLHQDHLDAASKTTCFHRLMQHHRQLRQLPNDLNWAHFKVNLSHWNEHHAQKPAFLELTNSETYLAAAQLQLEGPPFAHWALSEALALYP